MLFLRVLPLLLLFLTPAPEELATPGFADGDVLPYDLLVLPGENAPGEEVELLVRGEEHRFPVREGRFKALCLLEPGQNRLVLRSGNARRELELEYRPLEQERAVRFVYALAADGPGEFDAPPEEASDVASALKRMAVGARLMQSFTAEKMNARGHGRRTFRILRGEDGEPKVETFRSKKSLEELRSLDGGKLWRLLYGELGELPDRSTTIDVVVMGFTRWDPEARSFQAHTALGGGRLGLFGSGQLSTWAETIEEIGERFTDARRVPAEFVGDDSAGRGSRWSNYSTTLGATLHESGHCFGLPHTDSGIMSRGFDHLNRSFVVFEPPLREGRLGLTPILPDQETGWHESSAAKLADCPWFATAPEKKPLSLPAPLPAEALEVPRLVVVISVDQMIPEQLERLAPWWQGGFARFLEQGLVFPHSALTYTHTETGPGHATFGTGCSPATHGIVENDYLDRETGKFVYCVADESVQTISSYDWSVAERRSASPARLLAPGWADLLKQRWPASRSFSISGKDRAAILLAGQEAELVLWWDKPGRGFVSSTAYVEELPDWVSRWNENWFEPLDGWVWRGELPGEASLTGTARDDRPGEARLMDRAPVFPYPFPELPEPLTPRDQAGLARLVYNSPWVDRFTVELARRAVVELELGADEDVDLLSLSLSACDSVGHACGPYSREVTDLLLRADRELGALFDELDERVGEGAWIAVLGADHGALELSGLVAGKAVGIVRLPVQARRVALENVRTALNAEFGEAYGVNIAGGGNAIFFPDRTLEAEGVDARRVREVVARTLVDEPWIAAAYTHDELIAPPGENEDSWLRLARASHRADRGSDVEIRLAHRHLMGMGTGTSHGSPYLYDRRVPLAFLGPGFVAGQSEEKASPMDALPTALRCLGVEVPPQVEGRPLVGAK